MSFKAVVFILGFTVSLRFGYIDRDFWQSILVSTSIIYVGYLIGWFSQLYDFWKTRGVGFLINIAIGQFFTFGVFNSIFYCIGSLIKYVLTLI